MDDKNTTPWVPPNRSVGPGEGEAPLATQSPQTNPVEVRTMNSDIASVNTAGGGTPRPYIPPPSTSGPSTPPSQPFTQSTSETVPQSNQPSSTPATSKPFVPPPIASTSFTPPVSKNIFESQKGEPLTTQPSKTTPSSFGKIEEKKHINGFVKGSIVILILVGLGFATYTYVLPFFLQNNGAVITDIITPTLIEPFPDTQNTNLTTDTPSINDETSQLSSEPPAHISFFRIPAESTIEKVLSTITLQDIVRAVPFVQEAIPSLKEIVFHAPDDAVLRAKDLMPLFAPTTFTEATLQYFNPDITTFMYTNTAGTWLGVALQLTSDASLTEATEKIRTLEAYPQEITNFYLTDPGAAGIWKDGKINNFPGRYITLTASGTSLNYIWLNRTLLISANYDGAKEAVRRLGL